jgi:hypothetical protein
MFWVYVPDGFAPGMWAPKYMLFENAVPVLPGIVISVSIGIGIPSVSVLPAYEDNDVGFHSVLVTKKLAVPGPIQLVP